MQEQLKKKHNKLRDKMRKYDEAILDLRVKLRKQDEELLRLLKQGHRELIIKVIKDYLSQHES